MQCYKHVYWLGSAGRLEESRLWKIEEVEPCVSYIFKNVTPTSMKGPFLEFMCQIVIVTGRSCGINCQVLVGGALVRRLGLPCHLLLNIHMEVVVLLGSNN